jgi:DNA-binding LacI/PurR family transcriptional regulator
MSDDARPGPKRKVTSFDVAQRAAVSRAFTPNASVSPETRQKVVQAAKDLGYRVNYLARGLINQRSSFVGVVAAGIDNPFRSMQIEQIAKALVRRGLQVPEQIRVIGHDDVPQAAWAGYELTTIRQPCDLQAEQAVDLLQRRMADPDLPERTETTPVELIRRKTA